MDMNAIRERHNREIREVCSTFSETGGTLIFFARYALGAKINPDDYSVLSNLALVGMIRLYGIETPSAKTADIGLALLSQFAERYERAVEAKSEDEPILAELVNIGLVTKVIDTENNKTLFRLTSKGAMLFSGHG